MKRVQAEIIVGSALMLLCLLAGCGFEEQVLGYCTDTDGDGWSDVACGGKDCVDSNPRIFPGAVEACNLVDDDCDTDIDEWVMTTVAGITDENGDPVGGYQDGNRRVALLNKPIGISWTPTGKLYLTESVNPVIRAIDLGSDDPDNDPGYVTTIAGRPGVQDPLTDGTRQQATFKQAWDIAWVPGGPRGILYVADKGHGAIRRVDLSSTDPDNDPGYVTTIAAVASPAGLAVDETGDVFVSDNAAHCIHRIHPVDPVEVTTFAGLCGSGGFADGTADTARFTAPAGLAMTPEGNLLVADGGNHRIRSVAPSGTVTTLAGTGDPDHLDGRAQEARFKTPSDVAVDRQSGNIYICDLQDQRIRVLDPSDWVLTIIGTGSEGYNQDGPACGSQIADPFGVVVDSEGNFYISDANNYMVRKVTP